MLQVSIPSCDRSVFSTELICMNCDASVTEVASRGLDDKGSVSSGSRDLSLCHYVQTDRGSTLHLTQWFYITGSFLLNKAARSLIGLCISV